MLRQFAAQHGVILTDEIQDRWLDEMDRAGIAKGDHEGRRRALTRAVVWVEKKGPTAKRRMR
jgi:hypothetical protein